MTHDPSTGPAGVIHPLDMKYVPKRWGWELWICNNDRYCGKKLFVKQGHWLSYHHHAVKDEVLFVEQGSVWFTVQHAGTGLVTSSELKAGQAYHVTPGIRHQIQAISDATLFEFSTRHEDADSYRTTTDLVVDHGDNGRAIRTHAAPAPRVMPHGTPIKVDLTPPKENEIL